MSHLFTKRTHPLSPKTNPLVFGAVLFSFCLMTVVSAHGADKTAKNTAKEAKSNGKDIPPQPEFSTPQLTASQTVPAPEDPMPLDLPMDNENKEDPESWLQIAEPIDIFDIHRTHAYFMNDEKVFRGKVAVPDNAQLPKTISFSQNGHIIRTVPVGRDGLFEVNALVPGPYGLHFDENRSMITYGVYIATTNDLRDSGYSEEEVQLALKAQQRTPIWLNSYSSHPGDYELVKQLLNNYQFSFSEEVYRKPIHRMLRVPPDIDFNLAAQGTSIHEHVVRLQEDGTMFGRTRRFSTLPINNRNVVVPAPDTDLHFIQNGRVVASARSGLDGTFMSRDLTEGDYTLVALGPAGLAVFSFVVKAYDSAEAEDVVKTSATNSSDDETQFVNLQENGDEKPADAKVALLIPGQDGTELLLDVALIQPLPEPFVPGIGGAARAFGGGGGGGGAGLLFLLPIPFIDSDDDPNSPKKPEPEEE